MDNVSNARPIAIFASYMVTALLLTTSCITTIVKQARKSKTQQQQHQQQSTPTLKPNHNHNHAYTSAPFITFTLFATISLLTTWSFMFRYFQWSYLHWLAASKTPSPPSSALLLGDWLHDTSLFKQAWGSTLETAPRAWWSLQIFGFCAVWSVMLAVQSKKRSIPHPAIFMLLGQIVAISFAMNLFFLATLVSDPTPPPPPPSSSSPATKSSSSSSSIFNLWHISLLALTTALALAIPNTPFTHPQFLPLLLAPHVLAFVPLLLKGLLPLHQEEPSWLIKASVVVAVVTAATINVTNTPYEKSLPHLISTTLFEHPAVSSVGSDVICCWISLTTWAFLGRT